MNHDAFDNDGQMTESRLYYSGTLGRHQRDTVDERHDDLALRLAGIDLRPLISFGSARCVDFSLTQAEILAQLQTVMPSKFGAPMIRKWHHLLLHLWISL